MRWIKVISKILTTTAVSPISACAVVPQNMMMMVSAKVWLTQLLAV